MNTSNIQEWYTSGIINWQSVLHLIIGVLAVVGNSLVISFFCTRKKRTLNGKVEVQLSLAFVDLMTGVSMIVSQVGRNLTRNNVFFMLGKALAPLITVSLYHLSLLGIIGYYAISNPIRYMMSLSKCKLTKFCILVWLTGIPTVFFSIFSNIDYSNINLIIINLQNVTNTTEALLVLFGYHLYSVLLPFFATVISTVLMTKAYFNDKVRKQNGGEDGFIINKRERNLELKSLKSQRNRNRKNPRHNRRNFVKMTTLMVVGYSITCLPIFVGSVVSILTPFDGHEAKILLWLMNSIFLPLAYGNSLVTIVVYFAMDADFKVFAKKLCRCSCFRSNPPSPSAKKGNVAETIS